MVNEASRKPSVEGGGGNALVQFYRYVFGIGHERNIGGPERTIRYTLGVLFTLVGLGVLAFAAFESVVANTALAVVLLGSGLFLIYEARVQYCPLNHTIGRSTYSEE